jgi:hypothetical protein
MRKAAVPWQFGRGPVSIKLRSRREDCSGLRPMTWPAQGFSRAGSAAFTSIANPEDDMCREAEVTPTRSRVG